MIIPLTNKVKMKNEELRKLNSVRSPPIPTATKTPSDATVTARTFFSSPLSATSSTIGSLLYYYLLNLVSRPLLHIISVSDNVYIIY